MSKDLQAMSITEMQRELSANLRVMEKLYPDGRYMISHPNRPDQFSKSRTKEDKLNDVLQWIALCFMTGGNRKNVSAAFTPGDTSMTFHLSSYPNPNQTKADMEVIAGFKAATIKALKAMRRDMDKYDPKSDLNQFRDLAVKYTWPEIWKKIYKIRDTKKYTKSKVHNLLETFQKRIKAWDEFQMSRSQPTSQPLANTAIKAKPKGQTPTIDTVIDSYRQLLTCTEPVEHPSNDLVHDRSAFMAQMLEHCEVIDTSAFMKDSLLDLRKGGSYEWQHELGHENAKFLKEVRKHIRRLRMYSAGMTTYLKDGLGRILPAFKTYQDPNSFLQYIQFNWIKLPENTTTSKVTPVNFPGKPAPWVTAQLSSFDPVKVHAVPHDKIASLNAKADTLWRDGEVISGTVHCEIALVSYVIKNDIRIQHGMIGTARAICLPCQYYINNCRNACPRNFYYDSIACKIAYDWMSPSVAGAPEEHWEKPCLAAVCKRARELAQTTLLLH